MVVTCFNFELFLLEITEQIDFARALEPLAGPSACVVEL